MKLNLYLMNKKGLRSLEAIINSFGADIVSRVVSSRDRGVKDDYYEQIEKVCSLNSITFVDRKEDQGPLSQSLSFAIGWRWLIEPSSSLIVFHDSLLPKYRGFAPLVTALIKGEPEVGVSAIIATKEYDRGDIVSQKRLKVEYPTTIGYIIDRVGELYADIAVQVIDDFQKDKLVRTPQNESNATYSVWRDEEDYLIDWNESSESISNFINAVGFPYQGASTRLNDKLIRILEACPIEDVVVENRHVGKTIFKKEGKPVVICRNGLLKIEKAVDVDGADVLPTLNFRCRFR